mgnify:CR=1 FL=1
MALISLIETIAASTLVSFWDDWWAVVAAEEAAEEANALPAEAEAVAEVVAEEVAEAAAEVLADVTAEAVDAELGPVVDLAAEAVEEATGAEAVEVAVEAIEGNLDEDEEENDIGPIHGPIRRTDSLSNLLLIEEAREPVAEDRLWPHRALWWGGVIAAATCGVLFLRRWK